jgi:hypothetical protein
MLDDAPPSAVDVPHDESQPVAKVPRLAPIAAADVNIQTSFSQASQATQVLVVAQGGRTPPLGACKAMTTPAAVEGSALPTADAPLVAGTAAVAAELQLYVDHINDAHAAAEQAFENIDLVEIPQPEREWLDKCFAAGVDYSPRTQLEVSLGTRKRGKQMATARHGAMRKAIGRAPIKAAKAVAATGTALPEGVGAAAGAAADAPTAEVASAALATAAAPRAAAPVATPAVAPAADAVGAPTPVAPATAPLAAEPPAAAPAANGDHGGAPLPSADGTVGVAASAHTAGGAASALGEEAGAFADGEWYYQDAESGEAVGPLTWEEMVAAAAEDEAPIVSDSYVFMNGMEEWLPADAVPSLLPTPPAERDAADHGSSAPLARAAEAPAAEVPDARLASAALTAAATPAVLVATTAAPAALAASAAAGAKPALPLFPRRPGPVADAAEHARRQAAFDAEHAAVARAREERKPVMHERHKQQQAEAQAVREDDRAAHERLLVYGTTWDHLNRFIDKLMHRELSLVLGEDEVADQGLGRVGMFKDDSTKMSRAVSLHMKHCMPPPSVWVPLVNDSDSLHDLQRTWRELSGNDDGERLACARRRRILGAPPLPASDDPASEEWERACILRRVADEDAPPYSCSLDACTCEAVVNAPPLTVARMAAWAREPPTQPGSFYHNAYMLAARLLALGCPRDSDWLRDFSSSGSFETDLARVESKLCVWAHLMSRSGIAVDQSSVESEAQRWGSNSWGCRRCCCWAAAATAHASPLAHLRLSLLQLAFWRERASREPFPCRHAQLSFSPDSEGRASYPRCARYDCGKPRDVLEPEPDSAAADAAALQRAKVAMAKMIAMADRYR